ncbi:eCIS core domain-containing protein [Natrinema altunense]|uniref:DUF4157 domain-containing protein n=1 Tax=Natrinema altunense TaxID=222984 RepID=A0A482XV57_9EURY|nr:DUF4157 domain-containing protein [Natrinema altunense]RZH67298.1 DUF4157 domain-containing protein [Natrinema altunense]
MGFRSARDAETTADRRSQQSETVRSSPDHESDAGGWSQRMPLAEAEEQYGMSIPNEETLFELQRLEASNPIRVHEWIEEGMTVEDMRDPNAAEAFRERQAARPEAIPDDIERQNKRSVLRSEKAAAATEPAGDAGVPDPVRDVIQSTGQPLDDGIQQAMEERMGDSFGDVHIHADATAANACEEINARAFTVGNHIAFNHGEYDPESPKGQHILAHELAHVRQQTGADISMMPQDDSGLAIDPDPQLEREAEDAAQQVLADGPVVVNRKGIETHIQRAGKDWNHGPSVAEELYGDDEVDLEELGIDPDDLDIDEDSLMQRVTDGLKEGSLRSVLAGAIAASATIATSGGAPAIAGGAAAASALVTTTAANTVFGGEGGVPEQIVEQMTGAVAKSEAFAKEAAQNETLAKNLASNETLLSNLAGKLDGLTGQMDPRDLG